MSAINPNKKIRRTNWRDECNKKFGLTPVPKDWESEKLKEISQADNEIWKRYYDYRIKIKSLDEDEEDSPHDEKRGNLWIEISDGLKGEIENIASSNEESKFLANSWLSHSKRNITHLCWEYSDELRSGTYSAIIFSPYSIPHAISLKHRYHNRDRFYSVEFHVTWEFKLIRFDDKGPGDTISKKLAKRFPGGWHYSDESPCIYNALVNEELLCSDCFIDPPSKAAEWTKVEHIDVSNLTPGTIYRIREWLYGSSHKSREIIDDFSFLRLLFAACGCADFKTPKARYIGYKWHSSRSEFMDQVEKINPKGHSLNWLEYQVRLISGTLRPLDKFYEPYDILAAKSYWGREVLERRAEENSGGKEDDHILPWMIWDEEANYSGFGSNCDDMMYAIQMKYLFDAVNR